MNVALSKFTQECTVKYYTGKGIVLNIPEQLNDHLLIDLEDVNWPPMNHVALEGIEELEDLQVFNYNYQIFIDGTLSGSNYYVIRELRLDPTGTMRSYFNHNIASELLSMVLIVQCEEPSYSCIVNTLYQMVLSTERAAFQYWYSVNPKSTEELLSKWEELKGQLRAYSTKELEDLLVSL